MIEILPRLEMCQQIPEGLFTDSVFVFNKKNQGVLRSMVDADDIQCPAPTLTEILEESKRQGAKAPSVYWEPGFYLCKGKEMPPLWVAEEETRMGYKYDDAFEDTPQDAALELLLRICKQETSG